MIGTAEQYWSLGDQAELDRIEAELGKAAGEVSATAEAVAEITETGVSCFRMIQ